MHRSNAMNGTNSQSGAAYELRFLSLSSAGRGYAFPCDAQGHVDMDALSDRARNNYLYARALMGRDVSWPAVMHRD
jgi:hypothetical protein